MDDPSKLEELLESSKSAMEKRFRETIDDLRSQNARLLALIEGTNESIRQQEKFRNDLLRINQDLGVENAYLKGKLEQCEKMYTELVNTLNPGDPV